MQIWDKKPKPFQVMPEDRARGGWDRETLQPRTESSRTRAEGIEPKDRTDLQNKILWGVPQGWLQLDPDFGCNV